MNKQEHLLSCVAEEGGEVVQAANKALRFGLDDGYPGTDRKNSMDILKEFYELSAVIFMLQSSGALPILQVIEIDTIKGNKITRVLDFMEHAKSNGTLT